MSYSFSIRAADKAAAKAAVAAEMAKVIETQPDHAVDQDKAVAVAGTFIDLLQDSPDMDVLVQVSGSISFTAQPSAQNLVAANVSVSAWYSMRAQQTV